MTRTDDGSMVPILGLIAFASLLLVALAIELAAWGAYWREAAFVADAGAAAGAVQLDLDALYRGTTHLDPSRAEQSAVHAALAARPRTDRTATATADDGTVCVEVVQAFTPRLLSVAGVGNQEIRVTACASPIRG